MGWPGGCRNWGTIVTATTMMVLPRQALAWFPPHPTLASRSTDWRQSSLAGTTPPSARTNGIAIEDAATTAARHAAIHDDPAPDAAALGITSSLLLDASPTIASKGVANEGATVSAPAVCWHQARFSVSLPPSRGAGDQLRNVTNTVINGLAPLLGSEDPEAKPEGIGLLQVLNSTASLVVGPSPRALSPARSAAVALTLRAGRVVWGVGQEDELWLRISSVKKEGEAEEETQVEAKGEAFLGQETDDAPESKRGSDRYDFLVLWSAAAAPPTRFPGRGESSPSTIAAAETGVVAVGVDGEEARGQGGEGEAFSGSGQGTGSGRGKGPAGGHVVGELRPLNEFSAARQEALDKALEMVGVDPRGLTEADEFFGTAALKSYNTFVRPRPKQLAKVTQEPVARAALRTAHQVAFLVRRHRADRAEYLRNKDASMSEAERRGLAAHPVVLVCDNVRSAYNVGSIFRSADTARAAEVITCGFTPHPGGHGEDKVRKTAFGSIDAVPHRHFEDPTEAVSSLKASGAFVFALETTEGASSLFDLVFPLPPRPEADRARSGAAAGGGGGRSMGEEVVQTRESEVVGSSAPEFDRRGGGGEGRVVAREGEGGGEGSREMTEGGVVALVLGNEVTGVDERVLGMCDAVVEVPVFGLKNSLNVASAGTVVLYEVLRQWALAHRLEGNGD